MIMELPNKRNTGYFHEKTVNSEKILVLRKGGWTNDDRTRTFCANKAIYADNH